VLHDDHLLWPARGAGPRRLWELLLFLACQPPEGASRLTLMDALWPEADGALDGGHILRQLCYRLRTLLRCQVPGLTGEVVSNAAGVYRRIEAVVTSDAHHFPALERAFRCASGPAAIALGEQARSLCDRGGLLEGPAAAGFAWLDERDASGLALREHFAHLAHRLTWRLAELYVAAGRQGDAVLLYQELVEDDPRDERLREGLLRARGGVREVLREGVPRAS
jgi:DNA-binding SARP family transcriptional activator